MAWRGVPEHPAGLRYQEDLVTADEEAELTVGVRPGWCGPLGLAAQHPRRDAKALVGDVPSAAPLQLAVLGEELRVGPQ